MSEENVEIVRRMYDAYQRGDFESALAHFHRDVEWSEPPDDVEHRVEGTSVS